MKAISRTWMIILIGLTTFTLGLLCEYFVVRSQVIDLRKQFEAELRASQTSQESSEGISSSTTINETPEPAAPSEAISEPSVVEVKTHRRRPSRFTHFRAEFEVIVKKEQDAEYVRKQSKALRSLVRTIPTVKGVNVVSIKGGILEAGKVEYHEILKE